MMHKAGKGYKSFAEDLDCSLLFFKQTSMKNTAGNPESKRELMNNSCGPPENCTKLCKLYKLFVRVSTVRK